jgi:hypothetical protein
MTTEAAGDTEILSLLYKTIRLYTKEDRSISIHNSERLQISVPSVSLGCSGGSIKQRRHSIPILNTSAMQVWTFI